MADTTDTNDDKPSNPARREVVRALALTGFGLVAKACKPIDDITPRTNQPPSNLVPVTAAGYKNDFDPNSSDAVYMIDTVKAGEKIVIDDAMAQKGIVRITNLSADTTIEVATRQNHQFDLQIVNYLPQGPNAGKPATIIGNEHRGNIRILNTVGDGNDGKLVMNCPFSKQVALGYYRGKEMPITTTKSVEVTLNTPNAELKTLGAPVKVVHSISNANTTLGSNAIEIALGTPGSSYALNSQLPLPITTKLAVERCPESFALSTNGVASNIAVEVTAAQAGAKNGWTLNNVSRLTTTNLKQIGDQFGMSGDVDLNNPQLSIGIKSNIYVQKLACNQLGGLGKAVVGTYHPETPSQASITSIGNDCIVTNVGAIKFTGADVGAQIASEKGNITGQYHKGKSASNGGLLSAGYGSTIATPNAIVDIDTDIGKGTTVRATGNVSFRDIGDESVVKTASAISGNSFGAKTTLDAVKSILFKAASGGTGSVVRSNEHVTIPTINEGTVVEYCRNLTVSGVLFPKTDIQNAQGTVNIKAIADAQKPEEGAKITGRAYANQRPAAISIGSTGAYSKITNAGDITVSDKISANTTIESSEGSVNAGSVDVGSNSVIKAGTSNGTPSESTIVVGRMQTASQAIALGNLTTKALCENCTATSTKGTRVTISGDVAAGCKINRPANATLSISGKVDPSVTITPPLTINRSAVVSPC